jgi:Ca2+-binding EF-hand superfamily protein
VPITDEEIQKIFDDIDEDGSGVIEYQEFLRNVCNVQNLMSESNLRNVFHHVCGDKNVMTGEDVKRFVFHDEKVNENVLKEYFEEVGMKMEDSITFEEFFEMIKNNTKAKGKEEANDKDKSKELNKSKYKKKESKYAFKGPVIDEVKAEEEEVADSSPRNRKTYKEDEEFGENGGIKENGEIKLNGIGTQDEENGDGNGNEKLSTVADTIVDKDDKMKQLDDVI